jgi:hypothetical protein
MQRSMALMGDQGVEVELIRLVDHDVAPGVYPDMREQGWQRRIRAAASQPPRQSPYLAMACRAYWLQVGWKRQLPGNQWLMVT